MHIMNMMEADYTNPDYENLAEGMVTFFQDFNEIINNPELDLDSFQRDLLLELVIITIYENYTMEYTPYDDKEQAH